MSTIIQEIAPLQATTLEELRLETETRLKQMQQDIFLLKEFLVPAITLNENTPDVVLER